MYVSMVDHHGGTSLLHRDCDWSGLSSVLVVNLLPEQHHHGLTIQIVLLTRASSADQVANDDTFAMIF